MGWVKKVKACKHSSRPPLHGLFTHRPLANPGDHWQCEKCEQVFVVVQDWRNFELSWRVFRPMPTKGPVGTSGVSRPRRDH